MAAMVKSMVVVVVVVVEAAAAANMVLIAVVASVAAEAPAATSAAALSGFCSRLAGKASDAALPFFSGSLLMDELVPTTVWRKLSPQAPPLLQKLPPLSPPPPPPPPPLSLRPRALRLSIP